MFRDRDAHALAHPVGDEANEHSMHWTLQKKVWWLWAWSVEAGPSLTENRTWTIRDAGFTLC